MLYVVALEATKITIHPFQEAQIALLLANKAPTKVLSEHSDYSDVFSLNLAMELPEYTDTNDYAIKLEEGKQLPYDLIYSLGPVELKTLKT